MPTAVYNMLINIVMFITLLYKHAYNNSNEEDDDDDTIEYTQITSDQI